MDSSDNAGIIFEITDCPLCEPPKQPGKNNCICGKKNICNKHFNLNKKKCSECVEKDKDYLSPDVFATLNHLEDLVGFNKINEASNKFLELINDYFENTELWGMLWNFTKKNNLYVQFFDYFSSKIDKDKYNKNCLNFINSIVIDSYFDVSYNNKLNELYQSLFINNVNNIVIWEEYLYYVQKLFNKTKIYHELFIYFKNKIDEKKYANIFLSCLNILVNNKNFTTIDFSARNILFQDLLISDFEDQLLWKLYWEDIENNNRYDAIYNFLEANIENNKKNKYYYFYSGHVYLSRNYENLDKAEMFFKKALDIDNKIIKTNKNREILIIEKKKAEINKRKVKEDLKLKNIERKKRKEQKRNENEIIRRKIWEIINGIICIIYTIIAFILLEVTVYNLFNLFYKNNYIYINGITNIIVSLSSIFIISSLIIYFVIYKLSSAIFHRTFTGFYNIINNFSLIKIFFLLAIITSLIILPNKFYFDNIYKEFKIFWEQRISYLWENIYKNIDENLKPLHRAVFLNNEKFIRLLIDKGADVNIQTDCGWTPLHLATYINNEKIASLLIDKGADVNSRTNNAWTPIENFKDFSPSCNK